MQADPTKTDSALEEQGTADKVLQDVYQRAMRRFDECAHSTRDLRRESLAARRFVTIPGAQWADEWGEQFANSIRVEINKVGRGLRKIETDYRENRIVPDFRPDGDKADQETADMLDDLHRADSYRFKSQQARDNAAFEAFAGGFGAYRLTNEWEDESDRDNDHQRINPASLIVDADQSVFFDPNARLYDKSDARFAFIRTAMTRDAYEEQFGEEPPAGFPEGTDWQMDDWFTPDTVAIAEYYEVEERDETLWILTHSLSKETKRLWSSELGDGELAEFEADGWTKQRQRRKRKRVHKYVLSGAEVIEDRGLIAGEMIPIVPVYGQRYFVDNVERWKGYVHDKMDAQRLYNSNVSKLAELNSLSPREVPIFAPEQMNPAIADQWARANIERLPYLLAEPIRDENGGIVQMGPTSYVKPPDLPPALATLIQLSNGDLMEDMQDGADTVKANTSAEAMDIAATRVDAKSGIYLDNVRQSIQREGEIYVNMAADVYVEPGRKVETMTEDGDDGEAVLKRMATDSTGLARIVNDLQSGRYKVIASVTEATATRRDKTVKSAINLAEIAAGAGDAELAQVALLTAVMNQEGEGSDDMQAYARKRLIALGVVTPNDEEQAAIDSAAEGQQPDPMQEVAKAEAQRLQTEAMKNMVEIEETRADTKYTEARTIGELVKAGKTRRETLTGV